MTAGKTDAPQNDNAGEKAAKNDGASKALPPGGAGAKPLRMARNGREARSASEGEKGEGQHFS
ncbi:MAG: hypothetical protein DBX49_01015 [Clostridia bacterium]|nr:MAG: hypothetical protein DBX49_01015 [Clostridia bacterium]